MVAAEEMGHKGVRAMTPLDKELANELRVKLGKGRELPEELAAKPKRVVKPKSDGLAADGIGAKPRAKKKDGTEETVELHPAATIVKPRPVVPSEIAPEPPLPVSPAAEITPEAPKIAPMAPPPPAPVEPMRPAAAAPPAAPPGPAKPEPKIVPFRPL